MQKTRKDDPRVVCPHCNILLGHKENHPDCHGMVEIKKVISSLSMRLKGRAYLPQPRLLWRKMERASRFKRIRSIGLDFFRSIMKNIKAGFFEKAGWNEIIRPLLEGMEKLAHLLHKEDAFKKAINSSFL